MDRKPGLSVRLKLTLSYAGFLMLAGLLMLVAAWFAGTKASRDLILVALAGAVALWLIFDPLLGISLPAPWWWQGR